MAPPPVLLFIACLKQLKQMVLSLTGIFVIFWKSFPKAISEDGHKALLPQYLDKSQLEGPANIS